MGFAHDTDLMSIAIRNNCVRLVIWLEGVLTPAQIADLEAILFPSPTADDKRVLYERAKLSLAFAGVPGNDKAIVEIDSKIAALNVQEIGTK